MPFPPLPNDNHERAAIVQSNFLEPYTYVDSDWAADTTTRKSMSDMALILTGGPIVYKSKSQATVPHIKTEAECTAATDCAKTALYICSILKELSTRTMPPQLKWRMHRNQLVEQATWTSETLHYFSGVRQINPVCHLGN